MEKKKILVIDDEADFLSVLKGMLVKGGYEVVVAQDGEEGLEKIRAERPDLVICDIVMPKKDGYGVLKDVRQGIDKDLPFIMLTVVEDFKNVKKAYEQEADFYVSKPVEFALLLKNVHALLNLRRSKRV